MANRVSVEISANTTAYCQGIDQATESTQKYETETRKVSDATVNLNKELRAAKKEVQNLAAGYAALDEESKNSAFGKEMARQLQEAKEKAAKYIDMQADLQQELRNMASDTAAFDSLTQGVSVFMNTTSAALGVVAQLTGNEEDARKAVVAFTTAQSTLNAATQIQNALQKQSALMLGVTKVQTLAAAAADNIKAQAEGKNAAATMASTVAQKAFNLVAKANPYVLLATAILTVVGAITTYLHFSNKAIKTEEEHQKKIAETTKKIEEQRKTFTDASMSYAQTAAHISALRAEYMRTNDELKKTAILQDAAKEFKNLGIEVKSAADAQRILINQGNEVIQLITLQGKAAALAALQMEAFKKSYKMLMENGYDVQGASALAGMNKEVLALGDEIMNTNTKITKLKKNLKIKDPVFDNNKNLNKTKEEYKAAAGSLAALREEYSKYKQKVEKGIIIKPRLESFKKDFEAYEKQIKEKEIQLGFKMPDPKDIPFTEAWFKEEIDKLERQKAVLPVTAYIERDKLQKQIDAMKLKVKLETDGVEITGKQAITDAFNNSTTRSIKDIENAIGALENKLQSSDLKNLVKTYSIDSSKNIIRASHDVQEYIDKIKELRIIQEQQQKQWDEMQKAMRTPAEAAIAEYDKAVEKADELGNTLHSFGSIANSVGNIFKTMGEDTAAAMMTVVSATLDMVGQVIPQILKLIAAKQAEAMAAGTASAASLPYPANLGAIASIVATVLATFAEIYSALNGYANGGIVGGSSYSGDKLIARVNSGEMILNSRQQKHLFDMLDKDTMPQKGGSNVTVTGVIHGTDLLLVQKNTNMKLSKTGNNIKF